ncbi:ABC transporter ATP-binding protein [Streptomyces sp. ID05-39B]|uniref:ABC transporter ATP-binding protein n=1 Tax=Streptomyces sp. ID05-39B TaxID=3028664 RepID=UPI0029A7B7EC|nr:ABC transporter ATP-binding protein [Streptomyces sp. ID05-39B]MDX3529418.1 ABC transporter ATP-binding protein [Streptomyces sp. ID05-39B]
MLLNIEDLTVHLPGAERPLLANVNLQVRTGEVIGLVGESGSGKSTTAKAALRVLPDGAQARGRVLVDGTDVLTMTDSELRKHRSRTVAMVHQDPRSALNPVRRIGDFLTERLARTCDGNKKEVRRKAVGLLGAVGLSDPERRLRQYPHEMSGGMLQRVVIAGALVAEPRLLLADEATSALDVTTQAEILALVRKLREQQELGMLFITHDLHLAAAYCDRVYVMYAGRVVEQQEARKLFAHAQHPYTRGLLDCSPALGDTTRSIRPIPGRPPSLADSFTGCPFTARCPDAEPACDTWLPEPLPVLGGGTAACRRLPELPHVAAVQATPPLGDRQEAAGGCGGPVETSASPVDTGTASHLAKRSTP